MTTTTATMTMKNSFWLASIVLNIVHISFAITQCAHIIKMFRWSLARNQNFVSNGWWTIWRRFFNHLIFKYIVCVCVFLWSQWSFPMCARRSICLSIYSFIITVFTIIMCHLVSLYLSIRFMHLMTRLNYYFARQKLELNCTVFATYSHQFSWKWSP